MDLRLLVFISVTDIFPHPFMFSSLQSPSPQIGGRQGKCATHGAGVLLLPGRKGKIQLRLSFVSKYLTPRPQ